MSGRGPPLPSSRHGARQCTALLCAALSKGAGRCASFVCANDSSDDSSDVPISSLSVLASDEHSLSVAKQRVPDPHANSGASNPGGGRRTGGCAAGGRTAPHSELTATMTMANGGATSPFQCDGYADGRKCSKSGSASRLALARLTSKPRLTRNGRGPVGVNTG